MRTLSVLLLLLAGLAASSRAFELLDPSDWVGEFSAGGQGLERWKRPDYCGEGVGRPGAGGRSTRRHLPPQEHAFQRGCPATHMQARWTARPSALASTRWGSLRRHLRGPPPAQLPRGAAARWAA